MVVDTYELWEEQRHHPGILNRGLHRLMIEGDFAAKLDKREDIKLFVELPRWFEIETPIGKYNPDWAFLKHDDTVLYFVRETKGTKNFEKLRNSEAEKIRCGRRHFETLSVDFDVAVDSTDI